MPDDDWKYREYDGIKVRAKPDAHPQFQDHTGEWVDVPNIPPEMSISFENSYIIELPPFPTLR